jgi:hypothetical protein
MAPGCRNSFPGSLFEQTTVVVSCTRQAKGTQLSVICCLPVPNKRVVKTTFGERPIALTEGESSRPHLSSLLDTSSKPNLAVLGRESVSEYPSNLAASACKCLQVLPCYCGSVSSVSNRDAADISSPCVNISISVNQTSSTADEWALGTGEPFLLRSQ